MAKKRALVDVSAERKLVIDAYSYLNDAGLTSYIWEFIRRNKRYRDFYVQYMEKKGYWDDVVSIESVKGAPFKAPRYFLNVVAFGLKVPLDPNDICVNGLINNKPILSYFWDDTFNDNLIYEPGIDDDMLSHTLDKLKNVSGYSMWESMHPFSMHVHIDITVPFKMIQINLKEKFMAAQQRILDIVNERSLDNKSRLRFDEWKYYLQAYDLKHEKKYSLSMIANILLSRAEIEGNVCDNGYPGSKKIGRFIKSAKVLINGGYFSYLNQSTIKTCMFENLREIS